MTWQHFTTVATLLFFALASTWLLRQLEDNALLPDADHSRYLPDYVMVDFVSSATNAQGEPSRQIQAHSLQHYPVVDGEVHEPYMVFYHDARPTWFVRAPEARVSATLDTVHLLSGAQIQRYDAQGQETVSLRSADLLIQAEKQYAETYAPSLLETPQGEMRSRGLHIYMAEQRMEFLAEVQGRYEPK